MSHFERYLNLHRKRNTSWEAEDRLGFVLWEEISPALIQHQDDFFTKVDELLEWESDTQELINDMVFLTLWMCTEYLKQGNVLDSYKLFVKHSIFYNHPKYSPSPYSDKEFQIIHQILGIIFNKSPKITSIDDITYAYREIGSYIDDIYSFLSSQLGVEDTQEEKTPLEIHTLLSQFIQKNTTQH